MKVTESDSLLLRVKEEKEKKASSFFNKYLI